MATILLDLGRLDEAAQHATSAVVLARAEPRPAHAMGRLAQRLHILGSIQAKLDRHDEALAVATEAVALLDKLRGLHLVKSYRYQWKIRALAVGELFHAGRFADAIDVGEFGLSFLDEAVRFYSGHRAHRASLLWYLAKCHAGLGEHVRAAEMGAKAATDFRLVQQLPNLALTLEMLALSLTALARHEEADATMAERVEVYGRLHADDPEQHRYPFYSAWAERLDSLWSVGNREDAIIATEQFLPRLRSWAQADPEFFQRRLARLLSVHGVRVSLVGRESGLEYCDEALAIARRQDSDDMFATCLHHRAQVMVHREDWSEAALMACQAVAVRRKLTQVDPGHAKDLAASLNLWGDTLMCLHRPNEAISPRRELVEILRRQAGDPDTLDSLADALYDLAKALSDSHHHRGAVHALSGCLRYLRRRPVPDQARIARTLWYRAFDWNAIWRHGNARHDLSAAIELYRQLAATDPEKHHASLSATGKLMREWLERA